MSTEELAARLATAARAAFTLARQSHPGETFYCYALYTDALAAYILPTCCSEEGLGPYERWNPPDWPYHLIGEEHFDEVLDGRDDPWQLPAGDGRDAEVEARFEA